MVPLDRSRRRSRGALLRAALVAGLVGVLGSSCQVIGTRVHNLNELHAEDGHHLRSGNLLSNTGYVLHVGFLGVFSGIGDPNEKPPERFDNPVKSCMANLVLLEGFDRDDPRHRAIQVEWFSRLAVEDPWKLSREFCARQLGPLGRGQDIQLPQRRDPDDPYAGPDQARDAMARLIAAVKPLIARKGVFPQLGFMRTPPDWDELAEDAPPALVEVCAEIDGLALDLQGALRLLRAAALLEGATAPRDQRVAPLRATISKLERICIRESLLAALADRPPRALTGSHPGWNDGGVRAAALRSAVQVFGDQVLAEYLRRLDAQDDEVLITALNLVQGRGLPRLDVVPDEEWPMLRAAWIQAILRQATDHPNGQVRVAAFDALATIRGSGSRSLSEEGWYAWWREEVLPTARPAGAEASPDPAPQATP